MEEDEQEVWKQKIMYMNLLFYCIIYHKLYHYTKDCPNKPELMLKVQPKENNGRKNKYKWICAYKP